MIREAMTLGKLHRGYTGQSDGCYVSVLPTPDTRQRLVEWAVMLGFWLPDEKKDELHCTVMMSRNTKPVTPLVDSELVYTAKLAGFQYWPGHDDDGYIVATLDSPDLVRLHEAWWYQGATHSFDDYLPHVTLVSKLDATPALYQRMIRLSDKYRGTLMEFTDESIADVL